MICFTPRTNQHINIVRKFERTMNILQLQCVFQMFPVKNRCFRWLYSGKTCSTIFCQIPNIFIGQHEYTLHAILYCVTHIWNSDLAKIGAIHQTVWDVVPYVTKRTASFSPCFSWNTIPGVNPQSVLSSLSGLRAWHVVFGVENVQWK